MSTTDTTSTTDTVTVVPVTSSLLHRYAGQLKPQPCHVELDCAPRTLRAETDMEPGSAVPMAVHHGHRRRWTIPPLRESVATELLHEIAPLAERMCDGYSSRWDGSNHVARYTEDAIEAETDILAACERAGADPDDVRSEVTASDFFSGVSSRWDVIAEACGVTADTTDAEIAAKAEENETIAETEMGADLTGAEEYLRDLREQLRAAREASA